MEDDKKTITVEQYRGIDISIFFLLTCALEIINVFIFKKYFPEQMFCISIVLPMSLLVMQRWNGWAVLIALGGGIASCVASGDASIANVAVYGIGNCFVVFNLFWYLAVGKKKIQGNIVLKILFTASGYLLICIGRTLVSLLFEGQFIDNLLAFTAADGLNAIVGLVIILIAARQNGLFEDQIVYLKRQHEESLKENEAKKKLELENINEDDLQ